MPGRLTAAVELCLAARSQTSGMSPSPGLLGMALANGAGVNAYSACAGVSKHVLSSLVGVALFVHRITVEPCTRGQMTN